MAFLSPAEHMLGCQPPVAGACVAILMATYNGEFFLREQLDSIVRQSHRRWVLHVSDDGSSDATLDIVREYASGLPEGQIRLYEGPRNGFAQNFLSLVRRSEIKADFYAFCDQDDIWFEDRLSRSLQAALPAAALGDEGVLYCSRTCLVDEVGAVIGFSPLFRRKPSFCNALVQSVAGANTMLFDGAVRDLLARVPGDALVISHDWLAYMLTSGGGGQVVYDPEPTVYYRQHGDNLIGANASLRGRLGRLRRMLRGDFREWNSSNLLLLAGFAGDLTEQNQRTLNFFSLARRSGLLGRVTLLRRSGVWRQTRLDDLALFFATLFGRI